MGREIVTKGARFYCVSLQPDICKTPVGPTTRPVPYTVKGEFAEATGVSPDIRSNDEPVVIHASTVIPNVTGDEQGTAKGVKSGTVSKRVQHDQRSATVKFNGERAIRVGDRVFMNDKNTVGQVYERPGAPAPRAAGAAQAQARSGARSGTPSRPAVSSADTGMSFGRRVQDLLGLARNVQPHAAELAALAGGSPIALLAQGLERNPGMAGAGGGDAPGKAARGLLDMALKPLSANNPLVHDLLPKLPPFISPALLNRIPGVPPIVAQAVAASTSSGHVSGAPAPAPGRGSGPAPGAAARSPGAAAGASDGGSSRGRPRSVAARGTAAGPVHATGALIDEVRDKNGRLTPEGISEVGEVNYRMWNNKNIVYNRSGNREALEISGYVEDRGTGQGAAAVAAINRAFTRAIEHDGNTLSVKTDMKVARDAKQIAGAAFVLKECNDCEYTDRYYVGGRASLGGFPDHAMFLSPRATAVTYGHEFGHMLGLPHWHPYQNSIMAYDGIVQVGKVDVLRLFEIYRDPDAYWRRRQRRSK